MKERAGHRETRCRSLDRTPSKPESSRASAPALAANQIFQQESVPRFRESIRSSTEDALLGVQVADEVVGGAESPPELRQQRANVAPEIWRDLHIDDTSAIARERLSRLRGRALGSDADEKVGGRSIEFQPFGDASQSDPGKRRANGSPRAVRRAARS